MQRQWIVSHPNVMMGKLRSAALCDVLKNDGQRTWRSTGSQTISMSKYCENGPIYARNGASVFVSIHCA